jgi:hypothetical protein
MDHALDHNLQHRDPAAGAAERSAGGTMTVTAKRDLVELSLAPSPTEQEKAARTHTAIREHLETDEALKRYAIDTYLQGSYKNSTNVRGDSDVDMGSVTDNIFYYDMSDLPADPTQYGEKSIREATEAEIQPAPFTFQDYRRDVLASLKRKYGDVVDGNKSLFVPGNTYRLDADVLPCTSFRWYYTNWQGRASYHTGISFFTKANEQVVNFPKQHFDNLAAKDQRNDGKVKGCIRIFKRIRNELEDRGEWDRKRSPSYYLESLVWNAPDSEFSGGYSSVVQNVLAHLWNDLREKKEKGDLQSYLQANEVFVLFHPKFWNVDDALAFIDAVWRAVFTVST